MITSAPSHLAIWIAKVPTPPAPPGMNTRLPGPTRISSRSACKAVSPASGMPAAVAKSRLEGMCASISAGMVVNSASPPIAFLAVRAKTRSPGAKLVTPSPTASTTPANSLPITAGSG